jgi:HAE1 family hydrophobic/amphiphilic exporter-1
VLTACSRRLRPVLMTSLTTMVGLLPLALGLGEGGEVQAPLARTVIGGLASSAFITLLFIPCLYLLFERRREKHRRAAAEAAG